MRIRNTITVAALFLAALLLPQTGSASGGAQPPQQAWGFHGVFGKFDNAALKRGAQVAVGVCMGCHSIKYIKFDHLRSIGFTEAEVAELAESQGRGKKDRLISPLGDEGAKESFGIVPPDLSLMTKARKGYEDYTYGILTGYVSAEEAELVERVLEDEAISEAEVVELASALHLNAHHPEHVREVAHRIANGENFNKYFPGNFFAMPKPLDDGAVEYADGTESSLPQLSKDVTTFLAWAAEPTQVDRKESGIRVILYLILLTVMFYAVKRRIWARVH